MPTPTYQFIGRTTVSSPTSSVTLSSVPNTFRDLIVIGEVEIDPSASPSNLQFRLNSDSSSNYRYQTFEAENGFVNSGNATAQTQFMATRVVNTIATRKGIFQLELFDYATGKWKSGMVRSGAAVSGLGLCAFTWQSTGVVNSITIISELSRNFRSGTTFTIYGVSA